VEQREKVLLEIWKFGFITELRDKFKSCKYAFACKADKRKFSDVLISLDFLQSIGFEHMMANINTFFFLLMI
jgi:hypothetical protein